jgi:ABC-type uncharacterized transport system involved in gliding motility auxiliary subunit
MMEKLRKASFLLATLFILAALALKMFRPEWTLYRNIGAAIGGVFFLLSLYFERQSLKTFFSARATRHGINAVVMVLMVLGIIIVGNWIVSRHPLKYDTTKNKSFSLSSLTINSLKNLKKPVKITAFYTYSEDDASRTKMKTLLDDYQRQTKMLEVKMIDPLKNLPLVRQYGVERNGTTIIEAGTQKTTINSTEEEEITNAILKVSARKQVTIYFLQGHKEPSISDFEASGLSAVSDALKKSNYQVKELGDLIAKNKVPDDCDLLIIASPGVQLGDNEIKAIEAYLASGGRAVVLDDPRADPSLGKLLAAYDVQTANDIVVDDSCNFPLAGPVVPCVVPDRGTPVSKEFDNSSIVFFPESRSLIYPEKGGSKINYTRIASTSSSSWGETDKEKAQFDEGKDKKGPLTVGVIATRPADAQKKKTNETRVVIFGDVSFAQNQFIGWSPWNYRLLSNCIAWLTEQENLIHLPPRSTQADTMTLSSTQLTYIMLLVVIVMPLAVLATGIAVWVKRKKL